jgi:hypothetical protein
MEELVPEPEPYSLFEFKRNEGNFLKKVGIKPCVIRCFRPRSHAVALTKEHLFRLTETDTLWLKECGVAWERKRAVQLPLDFCDRQETVQET